MSVALERARSVLAEALEVPVAEIADDATLFTMEDWDSLAHMRLVARLEVIVERPLDADAIVNLVALDDVAAILDRAV